MEGLGVAFFATGPGLGLIMYILTTLEFPKHNHDFYIYYSIIEHDICLNLTLQGATIFRIRNCCKHPDLLLLLIANHISH